MTLQVNKNSYAIEIYLLMPLAMTLNDP